MMPQSLSLDTPPSNPTKRQRSRESRNEPSRPTSAGQAAPMALTEEERLARSGVRMPAYLNKSKIEIQASFQDLEWKQRHRMVVAMSNSTSPFRTDRSLTVLSRNRYGNVQPWENARIKLSPPIHGSDYINASPIKLRSLRQKGMQRGRPGSPGTEAKDQNAPPEMTRYIATQGPKADQVSHFWHMVMQQSTGEVGVIIMLTQCYEGLKEKCTQYFPLDKNDPILAIAPEPKEKRAPPPLTAQNDGDPFLQSPDYSNADTDRFPGTEITTPTTNPTPTMTATHENGSSHATLTGTNQATDETEAGSVELINFTHDASIGCEVRELKITFGDLSKTVYHYFYGTWADFGKPEAEDRLALLQLMRVSRQMAGDSPRIVHCSAGVGRTGTWIALDFLRRELEEGRLVESLELDVSGKQEAGEEEEEGNKKSKSKSRSRSRKPSVQKNGSETWGKSGPAKTKTTTPEPKDTPDVIYDTVDRLRIQRMMMVTNEVQYAFLYEAVKEAFIEKYAEKEMGATVTTAATEEPTPKVARMGNTDTGVGMGGVDGGMRLGVVEGDDDTVSEAETEIQGELGGDVKMGDSEEDPYAAVAPETIRRELQREEHMEAKDPEVL